ncbi:MAG: hypothetical protein NTV51_28060 [Verrucomicrobia bacterium]|nr:hypothetical protein [Verrucomicrobiota bacterium]
MSAIKLHLQAEELDAVQRYAESLGVKTEDVAYAALHRLMMQIKTEEAAINQEILEAREWRRENLPVWSDSARSVHIYECKGEDPSVPSDWRG